MIHLSGTFYRWLTGALIVLASIAVVSASVHTMLQAATLDVSIENEAPEIVEIKVNRSGNQNQPNARTIRLQPNTLSKYYAVVEISDKNSVFDIQEAFVTAYRSGLSDGASCARNPRNCYRASLSDGGCTIEPETISDGFVKCRFDFANWAEATFGEKNRFDEEEWVFDVIIEDSKEEQAHMTFTRELSSLLAVHVPEKTEFDLPESKVNRTVAVPMTFTNNGNVPSRFTFWLTDIQCEKGMIPVENQAVVNADKDFEINGSSGNVYIDIYLPEQQSQESAEATFTLDLDVPDNVVGPCVGQTTITGM